MHHKFKFINWDIVRLIIRNSQILQRKKVFLYYEINYGLTYNMSNLYANPLQVATFREFTAGFN